MRIDIITVLPELLRSPFEASIMKRAIDKGLVEVHFHNLRDYTTNKQKSVDDYPFGGGAGMVMYNAFEERENLRRNHLYVARRRHAEPKNGQYDVDV
mgnify:CR=1 FL=1